MPAPAVITSSVVSDSSQKDGSRNITERHTDQYGMVYEFRWAAANAQTDATQFLATHNAQLVSDLAIGEIGSNIANALNQIGPVNNYSTQVQNIAALRGWFLTAAGWPAAQMGNFINSLNLSDQSLITVFGVSAGAQLTALKANLAILASIYASGIVSHGQ